MNLSSDILTQSIGKKLKNYDGKLLGKMREIIFDKDKSAMQYIILSTSQFFGRGNRFFAIPACSELIEIASGGKIILNVDSGDLKFARGVSADKCPKPNFEFSQPIYELYKYSPPEMA
jgi:sporulation protein YlmC with PRC-barrel domain